MNIATLNLVLVVATCTTALVLVVMHRLHFSVKGTLCWACGNLVIACSLVLVALRGVLPDLVTVVIANTAIMYGYCIILSGMRSFMGRDRLFKVTLTAPAAAAPFLLWYSQAAPSVSARIVLVSIMGAFISGLIAYELLKRGRAGNRYAQWFTGAVYAGNVLFLLVRVLFTLFKPSVPDLFASGFVTVAFYLWSLVFVILGTAGMVMMVGEKLQAEVKTLKGIMPICAHCKKIRDDQGYWKQLEAYIRDHSEADFTHGICPDCQRQFYPDLFGDEDEPPPALKEP